MSIEAFIPSPTLSETELRLHYEKLNTIFNSLREIIFTIDIEKGIIENVNENNKSNERFIIFDWNKFSTFR